MLGAVILVLLAAGGVTLALVAGGGEGGRPAEGTAAPGSLTRKTGRATPSVDRSLLLEGAVSPPEENPNPPASELWSAGGRRFDFPVRDHSDIQDYYGTPRLYGLIHGGLDFGLPGAPTADILAACTGSVSESGESEELSVYLVVDCGDGWTTVYGFLGTVLVAANQPVKQGDLLAHGESRENHVHFEIRWQGVPVDAQGYLDLPVPETATAGTASATAPLSQGGAGPARPATPSPTDVPPTNGGGEPTATMGSQTPVTSPTATRSPPPTATATATSVPTATPTRTPIAPTPTPTPRPVFQ